MTRHKLHVKFHLQITDDVQPVIYTLQYNSINVTAAYLCHGAADPDTRTHIYTQNGAHAQLNSAALQYGSPGTAVCMLCTV